MNGPHESAPRTSRPAAPRASSQAESDLLAIIGQRFEGSLAAISSLRDRADELGAICATAIQILRSGGTIYTCGNGGSAAHALHLAEELIGRYRTNRQPFRAVCLNADSTALTCIANDFGFDKVFARQCDALVQAGDALIVFSTSGNSANLIEGLQAARQNGATTIGLLGNDGGRCLDLCDYALVVAERDSAFVQDAHQVALHLICETVEQSLGQA